MAELSELLKRQIALLPEKPGCYLMKDEEGTIIYIGKAKVLKNRVSQYFLRPQVGKVQAMVSHVHTFDFIIVHTNQEAFILEMNLIKAHHPRYNIMLMDDSHYPYIALRRSDAMLKIARNSKDRRYYYFGPFPSGLAAYKTIDLLSSLYPTRKCATLPKKACLYYHLGECLAPCENKIDESTYEELYSKIKLFLSGNISEAKKILKERMDKASAEERYEDAGEYLSTIKALEETVAKQAVETSADKTSRDVFALATRDGYLALSVLTYRQGMLLGKKSMVVPEWGDNAEQAKDLVEEYYQNSDLPSEAVALFPDFEEDLSAIYPETHFFSPKEGRLMEQIDLAALNASSSLAAHFNSARLEDDNQALLEELGKLLGIKTPYVIELFDNSHLQGSSPVGALVVYVNGERDKSRYRKFHLDEEVAGDDFHSMEEVTSRRYKRLRDEGLAYPDLILVDGGLPQVEACLSSLTKLGVDIPVAGLYKNDRHQTEGLVDKGGKSYPLDQKSPLFFLLMRMQDEVHRYAISFHKAERSKNMKSTLFDGVEGIGAVRKEKLRKHYPTLESLKSASESELAQFLPSEVARALYEKAQKL